MAEMNSIEGADGKRGTFESNLTQILKVLHLGEKNFARLPFPAVFD